MDDIFDVAIAAVAVDEDGQGCCAENVLALALEADVGHAVARPDHGEAADEQCESTGLLDQASEQD